jgi:hypothetical protein
MKDYIMSLGCDIDQYVEHGYTAPATTLTDTTGNKISNGNARETNAILGGLANLIFVKVEHFKSTK